MSLPSNPSNGQIASIGGSQYVYDSLTNRWIVVRSKDVVELESRVDSEFNNLRFNNLIDVNVSYPPDHNTVLSWDSDNNEWKTRQFTTDPLGAVAVKNDRFVTVQNQTIFNLTFHPIGDVIVSRNGIKLTTTSYSVSGKTLTYNPVNNENSALDSDDEIIITYNRGTSIAITAELADLTDVDVITVPPVAGQILAWDSDNSVFAPSSTLKEDLEQAISDRVFADLSLSNRINNLDSDLNARGSFYVQATPPTGSANSGWVNTTNMKLHVWDITSDTWIQVTLT